MKPCKLVRISTADAGEEGFNARPHTEVLHICCNMCIQDLPDMFTRSPKAEGIHIYISGKSLVSMLQIIHVFRAMTQ